MALFPFPHQCLKEFQQKSIVIPEAGAKVERGGTNERQTGIDQSDRVEVGRTPGVSQFPVGCDKYRAESCFLPAVGREVDHTHKK